MQAVLLLVAYTYTYGHTFVEDDPCPSVKLVWMPNSTQINSTSFPGTCKHGVEDGIVVRRKDGGFSMVAAEMYADPMWIAMQLGIYGSSDGLGWDRKRAVRRSSADVKDGNDPHAASWGPFFVHDPKNDTWLLSYVGYRSAPGNSSGWLENFEGTIYARYAEHAGDAGLDSSFGEGAPQPNMTSPAFGGDRVLVRPDDFKVNGPWPYECQGLQGTDSFYPYQLEDGSWAGFAGTSHQEADDKFPGVGKWPVSLATAPDVSGPWTRYNPANKSKEAAAEAPCVDINGGFTENPIVSRRPDKPAAFQMVFDDLAAEHEGFGYACSKDGLQWSESVLVPVPGGTRTPFGLLPMTEAEKAARKADVLAAGIITAKDYVAANTSLQWAFFTQNQHGWEAFRTSIVQIAW